MQFALDSLAHLYDVFAFPLALLASVVCIVALVFRRKTEARIHVVPKEKAPVLKFRHPSRKLFHP